MYRKTATDTVLGKQNRENAKWIEMKKSQQIHVRITTAEWNHPTDEEICGLMEK